MSSGPAGRVVHLFAFYGSSTFMQARFRHLITDPMFGAFSVHFEMRNGKCAMAL